MPSEAVEIWPIRPKHEKLLNGDGATALLQLQQEQRSHNNIQSRRAS